MAITITSPFINRDTYGLIVDYLDYADQTTLSMVCKRCRVYSLPSRFINLIAEISKIAIFTNDIKQLKISDSILAIKAETKDALKAQQIFVQQVSAVMILLSQKNPEKILHKSLPVFCQLIIANDSKLRQEVKLTREIVNNYILTLLPINQFVINGKVNLGNLCIYEESIDHQSSQGSQERIEAYGVKEPLKDSYLPKILKVLDSYDESKISVLDLRGNQFTAEGLPNIAEFCNRKKIKALLLSDQPLDNSGQIISDALKTNLHLKVLAISKPKRSESLKLIEASAKEKDIKLLTEDSDVNEIDKLLGLPTDPQRVIKI